ncbi:hypothetical protein EDB81DRAFT_828758 [Dactylonectria macrodidyma]|uniref:Uncharacterized protein n=1 Tax=Dactylonectria macrodidyma TaxID=307937 RepID=A0A9P9IA07_9HYPO|nr:hypothetical protein EDB81DRAFT_828758 [Dactylonectria macrodidyma]
MFSRVLFIAQLIFVAYLPFSWLRSLIAITQPARQPAPPQKGQKQNSNPRLSQIAQKGYLSIETQVLILSQVHTLRPALTPDTLEASLAIRVKVS